MNQQLLQKGKRFLRNGLCFLWQKSLQRAVKEQKLQKLLEELKKIVLDITEQYSSFKIDTSYLQNKVRSLHAFQIFLVDKVINGFANPTIVDIGDSAGTHIQYLQGLYGRQKQMNCLSINLDSIAVAKIKAKGLKAIQARAEDLEEYNINTDIFLCFEIMEHLMDPCRFLRELASKTNAKYLIITVPYVKNSRVGLHHIRTGREGNLNAETTHIFELNPNDWKLLAKHSGWQIAYEKIYFQYPKWSFLYLTKPLWKRLDFEGFYGMILKKDDTWSKKYLDW
ncbi:MAG: hypothetical protein Q8M83_01590 [bacterium]|nr:hypothetical protein [bacterium]